MKKRVLSMLMALIMVFSLMPVSVFAADTYAIGTVVESESVPNGAIPENSEWISSTTSTTGDLICTVEEEGHSHTAEAGCYATIVKTLWTLTAKAPEVKQEETKAECKGEAGVECGAETHIAGCDKYEAPKAECKGEAGVECGAETHIAGCDKYEAPKAECKGEAGVECGAETHVAGCDKYEAPAPEVKQCAADCVLVEGHEGECKPCAEGCIYAAYAGTPEHKGVECIVEELCPTEGCELIAGHPGECTGASGFAYEDNIRDPLPIHFFLATPGNITNPNGRYFNYYVPMNDNQNGAWTVKGITDDKDWPIIYTQDGIRNSTDEERIIKYVASWPGGTEEAFKKSNESVIREMGYDPNEYEIKWVSIMYRDMAHDDTDMRCQQYRYEGGHIHIDGLMVQKIHPGTMEVYKAIPEAVQTDTTFNFTLQKLYQPTTTSEPTDTPDGDPINMTATISAGSKEAKIIASSDVTFGYYKLTETPASGWENNGIVFDRTYGSDTTSTSNTLYINVAPNGTVQYSDRLNGNYTTMDKVTVQNKRAGVSVTYDWKLYNGSGYVAMPEVEGLTPPLPASVSNIQYGSNYVYDTKYDTGTSFINPQTGEMYTFHGWDVYSHSSTFSVQPSAYYTALDDGDEIASNNKTIPMTADTYIYGYWTVSQLPPASAHIAVEKKFMLDGQDVTANLANTPIASAAGLWFLVDPGIDKDGDGYSRVDIKYSAILAQNGEYKLPVYQYEHDFKFTEQDADVPGYTRTTKISVEGNNAKLTQSNGDYAEVALTEVYEGENIHLGTITYTNSYTKNTGAPVSEYPVLNLGKVGTDSGNQAGAEFTLYSNEALTNAVGKYTVPESGLVDIDFTGKTAGTYYLKETKAPAGYKLDPHVYTIKLIAGTPVEELRDGEYVQVTYFTLDISKPVESTAAVISARTGNSYSLTVYDEPILGQVTFTKSATIGGTSADIATALPNLNANVVVHGPITRNSSDVITDLGATYDLYLNSDNEWTVTQEDLPLGEYLVREAFASVHGYTWDEQNVVYGGLTNSEVHNGVKHAIFNITANGNEANNVEIVLTNKYEPWAAADFYVYKVDGNNPAQFLPGAEFTLYSDVNFENEVKQATTGPAGWAYFDGLNVPAGETSEVYYLKETNAPAGYYLDETVYKVEIKAVTNNGTTTFEPKITKPDGSEADFDNTTDQLTVANYPVLGKLTINKSFDGISDGLPEITLSVIGPNGYSNTVKLDGSESTPWAATLENLPLGEYTVTETNANVPGYSLTTTYIVGEESTNKVVLAEVEPGETTEDAKISGSVDITNTYTRNVETYEIPTSLTVKKVDQDGNPLAGAVFTLTRESTGDEISFTTNSDGKVLFSDMIADVNNGVVTPGKYTLEETTAPTGYVKTDAKWTITVDDDDLDEDGKPELRVELNADKNIFEQFWDWIISGIISTGNTVDFKDNTLTVPNVKMADLTIRKSFVDANGQEIDPPEGAIIEVSILDEAGKLYKGVELSAANGWTATVSDMPAGKYTVREASASLHGYTWNGGTFTVSSGVTHTHGNNAVIIDVENSAEITVDIENEYTAWEAADFYVMKTMEDGTTPLAGATFELYADNNGQPGAKVTGEYLHVDPAYHTYNTNVTSASGILHFHNFTVDKGQTATFWLKETAAPTNYKQNNNLYKVEITHDDNGYNINVSGENAKFNPGNDVLTVINTEILGTLTVEKTFGEENQYTPDYVFVDVTGPNGYTKSVTLNSSNGWKTTLTGLSMGDYTVAERGAEKDGYVLTAEYNGSVTLDPDAAQPSASVTIKNTYLEQADLTISKSFVDEKGQAIVPPEGAIIEISVLDASGKLYEEVELSEENNWTETVENLPAGNYTVREASASLHGYTWQEGKFTVGNGNPVTGSAVTINVVDGVDIALAIKNTYKVWEAADFYVMKTMEDGKTPLAGATFVLKDDAGNDVTGEYLHVDPAYHTYNTNVTSASGILHFHNFTVEKGQTATFWLEETEAPTNYKKNDALYKVTITHDDNGYNINVSGENAKFNPGNDVLTVINTEILGTLTIEKTFGEENQYTPENIFVDITGPNGYSNTVTLNKNNGWKTTLTGLHMGDYKVVESNAKKDGYELTTTYSNNGDVKLTPDENEVAAASVVIENTYVPIIGTITVQKNVELYHLIDAEGHTEKLNKAELDADPEYKGYPVAESYKFKVTIGNQVENVVLKDGESKTFEVPYGVAYAVEEILPEDHYWNYKVQEGDNYASAEGTMGAEVDGKTVMVENTYIFHDTSLTEVYEDLEDGIFEANKVDSKTGKALTGAKFGLYSDKECTELVGEAETVASSSFQFHFRAEGTYYLKELAAPENYKLSDQVYEIEVTADYKTYEDPATKETIILKVLRASSDDLDAVGENEDEVYLIPNEEYGKINISVSKVWLNPKDYDKQPTSVEVILYCDGEAYDTVVLSESNGWHYKWTGLYENHKWTVDEPNVPKEYSKKITHIGNAWVITNAHKDIPLTGDDSPVWLWAGAAGVAVVGLGTSLFLLLKKRKKDEDEQA